MKNNLIKTFLGFILFTISLLASYGQQSGWRGPGRSGIYNETGLMKTWPENVLLNTRMVSLVEFLKRIGTGSA